jgi:hypothetical protein
MPFNHTLHALLDAQVDSRHDMIRATTRAEVVPTVIRVQWFEMTKEKHNSPTENVIILLGEEEQFLKYRRE